MAACRDFRNGANRDRTGDLLLAKRPLSRPSSALKWVICRDFLECRLDLRIGADARGVSAITVVSGTFGDECLEDHDSGAQAIGRWRACADEGRRGVIACPLSRRKQAPSSQPTRRLRFVRSSRRTLSVGRRTLAWRSPWSRRAAQSAQGALSLSSAVALALVDLTWSAPSPCSDRLNCAHREIGQGHQPGDGLDRAHLIHAQALPCGGRDLRCNRATKAALRERARVDDCSAAALIECGQVAQADGLQLLAAHASAQRPALVHKRASAAGVDAADGDHDALAQRGVEAAAQVDRRERTAVLCHADDVVCPLAGRSKSPRASDRRRCRGHAATQGMRSDLESTRPTPPSMRLAMPVPAPCIAPGRRR